MSRMTRDDLAEMRRCNARPGANLVTKAQEQAQIAQQTAEFIARGGRIQGIPVGASGDQSDRARSEQAGKGGRTNSKRMRGTVGINRAAEYLGVPRDTFSDLVAAGLGPKCTNHGKLTRFTVADLNEWLTGKGVAA